MTCVIGFALSWGMNAYAQDKVFFVPDPETARWSYLEMDADGAPVATMAYSVDSMKGDAVNGFVKLSLGSLYDQIEGVHSIILNGSINKLSAFFVVFTSEQLIFLLNIEVRSETCFRNFLYVVERINPPT